MRIILYLVVFLFLAILPQTSFSQKGSQIKREVKIQRKQNAKASKRAAKYGKKRHMSIQDKATRKRMKKNLQDSKRRHKGMSR
jgi:Flp pilus assembly protein TadB